MGTKKVEAKLATRKEHQNLLEQLEVAMRYCILCTEGPDGEHGYAMSCYWTIQAIQNLLEEDGEKGTGKRLTKEELTSLSQWLEEVVPLLDTISDAGDNYQSASEHARYQYEEEISEVPEGFNSDEMVGSLLGN